MNYGRMDMSLWDDGAMQKALGEAIRTRRLSFGWSQTELGRRAKVNKETVNRAEAGTNVEVDTLIRLAKALDTTLEFRFGPVTGGSAVTSPVTHGEQTEPSTGGVLDVPTPLHRAVFASLALLPPELIEDFLEAAVGRYKQFHAKHPRETAPEDHARRQG